MSLDPKLLEVLACPKVKGPLTYLEDRQVLACPKVKGPLTYLEDRQVLANERLVLAYRIDDGIPVMLIDEATPWPPASDNI